MARTAPVCALAVWCGLIAAAQEPAPGEDAFRIRARAELVSVEVTVTDRRGEFVAGLARDRFRILDEGAEQPVTHFAAAEAPARVLLVAETSPAVYLIHRQHLAAAHALLAGLAADDEVALAAYDERLHPLLGFSADRRTLAAALGRLRYNLGTARLALFESLAAALDRLAALPGRKAVVLLSTGLDSTGAAGSEALVERLRASDVVIYPVALGGELRDYRGPARPDEPQGEQLGFQEADRALRRLAEESGGQAFFPRRGEEFAEIYRRIARALRHHYSLGFRPAERDGRFRRIEVQLLDERGRVVAPGSRARFRLHHRPGYLAPGPR